MDAGKVYQKDISAVGWKVGRWEISAVVLMVAALVALRVDLLVGNLGIELVASMGVD